MTVLVDQEVDEFRIDKLDLSHIVTEDDTPVDNLFSERQMRLLVESLYVSWLSLIHISEPTRPY